MKDIFFLGPKTSYSDLAKETFAKSFGITEFNEKPMHTITAIVSKINEWDNDDNFAVLPIENAIEGIVNETIDNLHKIKNKNIKILGETVISIDHCLVGYAKDKSEIKKIISHPQALSQCYNYIYENFGDNINLMSETSTANAVKSLSEDNPAVAAIGNKFSANYFNKPVIEENINDEKFNQTRFILLGTLKEQKTTKNDKTSIMFSTENKSGALCDILAILRDNDINMTYISSRPSKKSLGEYTFFIDFDGNILDDKIAKAMFLILQNVKTFKHFGSYPKFVNNIIKS